MVKNKRMKERKIKAFYQDMHAIKRHTTFQYVRVHKKANWQFTQSEFYTSE